MIRRKSTVYWLDLAGQHWRLKIPRSELDTVHWVMLDRFLTAAAKRDGRYVVFIAGPPGSGKTTLAALWEKLAHEVDSSVPVQALPMDGFHYPNSILDLTFTVRGSERIPLRQIKGAPESFDLPGLTTALRRLESGNELMWPRYDRKIHDPIPHALSVIPRGVILVEGNYLLFDDPGWKDLSAYADVRVFIECEEAVVRHDVLLRATHGGRTRRSALAHYEYNDHPNYRSVMEKRVPSDIVLHVGTRRRLTVVENRADP